MISVIVNILIVVAILGFLIFIHELGHFITAKLLGVRVDEFAIGFGPKIFSKKRGEVLYTLRAFPIGGFVSLLGEDPENVEKKDRKNPRNFQNKPVWARIIILLGGVFMNLVFALGVYQYFIHSVDYQWEITPEFKDFEPTGAVTKTEQLGELEYDGLVEGGGAEKAGIPEGGTVKTVDGNVIKYSYLFREYISSKAGESVLLNICDDDDCIDYQVIASEEGKVGIYMADNYKIYWDYSGNKVFASGSHAINMVKLASQKLGEMFSKAKETGDYSEVSASVSGPVGVYIIVDVFKKYGFLSMLGFTADFSLTLVVMNLLPIPALDGGRVFILLIEGLRGKPLNRKLEAIIINGSFIILLLLMVLIMFKDILFFDQLREMFR